MTAGTLLVFSTIISSSLSFPTTAWPAKGEARKLSTHAAVNASFFDWQKDGQPAQWANSYPKTWDSEIVKYTQPSPSYLTTAGPGSVTPDGNLLIMGNTTNIRITDLATGNTTADFAVEGAELMNRMRSITAPSGGYSLIVTFQLDYENKTLQEYTLSLSGIPSSTPISREGGSTAFEAHPFSNDGRYFAAHRDEGRIYSLSDPDYALTLSRYTFDLIGADWSSDGATIATAGFDGVGKLWDAHTGTFIRDIYAGVNAWNVQFSLDGKHIATGGEDQTVRIYTTGGNFTSEPIATFDGFPDWVRSLEWSPKGDFLAGGGWDQVQVYSMAEERVVQKREGEAGSGQDASEVKDLVWLDGGRKIAYRVFAGLEVYNFDANLKYRWGRGEEDDFVVGVDYVQTWFLPEKGWAGGFDPDHAVRFWEFDAEA
ncbi:WD40 repeat-like protein [Bimuria novae-zelandiae CBS 107.79]|uniref:WD40 repeat-like protein n=1 Tax=Bimuria novae-zelandiae CBS 107.79 TaxID=1447943 RepID=A0A6A5VGZ6_9PLEO|nr:WD40 repeat-like protein [Bimuria novae-zelandiae CBS 107.79]